MEWFENEEFWLEYAPIIFDSKRWAEAPTVADQICKIAGLNKGMKLLDAGCGPGRIAVELASRGLDVTGVDLVQGFLDAAEDTAKNEGVNLNLIKSDLRNFKSPVAFDAAINLYTSFGYCETQEEDEKIVQSVANSLKKGGWFILELMGREIAVRDFTEGEWFERAGKVVLTEFSVVGAWEGLQSKWILIDVTGARTEHVHVQRLYSSTELRKMLLGCGFSSVEVYGDFDFSPYNEKARTTVVVARK